MTAISTVAPLCKGGNSLAPPIKGNITMIAQAGQVMLLQVFVCRSATVQSVAEDHDLLAPSLLAFDHLQKSGAISGHDSKPAVLCIY